MCLSTRQIQYRLHEHPLDGPVPLRLLAILGPSGSGKSSVARAGLLPKLAEQSLPGKQRIRVAVLTPGTRPLQSLATILARIATGDPVPVAGVDQLQRRRRYLLVRWQYLLHHQGR